MQVWNKGDMEAEEVGSLENEEDIQCHGEEKGEEVEEPLEATHEYTSVPSENEGNPGEAITNIENQVGDVATENFAAMEITDPPLDGTKVEENVSNEEMLLVTDGNESDKSAEEIRVSEGGVLETGPKVSESEPTDKDEGDNNKSLPPRELTYAEKEAKLNAFLEEQERQAKLDAEEAARAEEASKKPKRRTRAELLKSLPGILKMKPKIRPSSKAVIDFDEDFKTVSTSKKKGIEDLMNRFMVHTAVSKPPKEEHYKIHITKKEEDSQGVTHVHTDEADYVKIVEEEEPEDMTSPLGLGPGVRMAQVKEKMMAEIRAKRAQAYKEKVKVHAMYSDEKDLEEKGEAGEEDEELLLDDDMSEEESEGEDGAGEDGGEQEDEDDSDVIDEDAEENIEDLLNANPKEKKKSKKKKRRRLVYLEEEADESGEERSADEDEDRMEKVTKDDISFIDDRPISDDEDDESDSGEKSPKKSKEEQVETRNNPLPKHVSKGFSPLPDSEEPLLDTQPEDDGMSQDLFSDFASQHEAEKDSQPPSQNPAHTFLDPNKTPILSSAVLSQRASPMGPWNSISSYQPTNGIRHPGSLISPLIPRLNSESALEAFYEDLEESSQKSTPKLSAEVAKLVGSTTSPTPATPTHYEDELEGICSARFPSQQPETPQESQDYGGFPFHSQDEDPGVTPKAVVQTPRTTAAPKTPAAHLQPPRVAHETPKTGETSKLPRNTRLIFPTHESEGFDVPSTAEPTPMDADGDDEEEEEEEAVIGAKRQKKRKRRLQFSDDESDGENEDRPKAEPMDHAMADTIDESEAEEKQEEENSDLTDTDEEQDSDDVQAELDEIDKEFDENEEEIVPKFLPMKSTKTGKIRKEFVDAEAELSGSEVGSADEDERGLDEYDQEEADAEVMDEDKLRDQVGRAHLKQLLDEDQREIRYLQDVYLEDGDLHSDGKGRERKFKWKNLDDLAFEGATMEDGGIELIEDELEIKRRQEKVEKLKWLRENSQSMSEDAGFEETSQKLLESSQFLKLGKATLKKLQRVESFSETTVTVTTTKSSSPGGGTVFERKGSFLQRETTLTRLAEMSRLSDTISKKASGKGFVFQHVTPPNDPNGKSKKATKRDPAQPKKMIKMDRSFGSLSESERSKSIFSNFKI